MKMIYHRIHRFGAEMLCNNAHQRFYWFKTFAPHSIQLLTHIQTIFTNKQALFC